MTSDKDSKNISRDDLTGLKSRAYFLLSLENSIAKLSLPNPSKNNGVVAVYLGNAPEEDLVTIATMVDRQTDYATHYKKGPQDVVAGVYEGSEVPLNDLLVNLQAKIAERFPKLMFGVAHSELKSESEAEKLLDMATQAAYDSMLLQRPAP